MSNPIKPLPHIDGSVRAALRRRIISMSSFLETALAALVLLGLLLAIIPLLCLLPQLVVGNNEVTIRTFLEYSLDIVIGIEFIKMLTKHSPGSSLEVLLYAIARHLVVGHDSAIENLISVGAIALIFIVRKYFFVPAFGAHFPDNSSAPGQASGSQVNPDEEDEEDDEDEDEEGGYGIGLTVELPHLAAKLLDQRGKKTKPDSAPAEAVSAPADAQAEAEAVDAKAEATDDETDTADAEADAAGVEAEAADTEAEDMDLKIENEE